MLYTRKGGMNPPEIGVPMKAKVKPGTNGQPMIATMRLDLALDMDRELVRLAGAITWDRLVQMTSSSLCVTVERSSPPSGQESCSMS